MSSSIHFNTLEKKTKCFICQRALLDKCIIEEPQNKYPSKRYKKQDCQTDTNTECATPFPLGFRNTS